MAPVIGPTIKARPTLIPSTWTTSTLSFRYSIGVRVLHCGLLLASACVGMVCQLAGMRTYAQLRARETQRKRERVSERVRVRERRGGRNEKATQLARCIVVGWWCIACRELMSRANAVSYAVSDAVLYPDLAGPFCFCRTFRSCKVR